MSLTTIETPPVENAVRADTLLDQESSRGNRAAWQNLFGFTRSSGRSGAFTLFQNDDWLLGTATVPLTTGLATATRQLYENIFQATAGFHLARIWNHVPAINGLGPNGVENYHLFCLGRSLAFEKHHGGGFKTLLPAASAVGCHSPALTITFVACHNRPRHVENPLQIPAYNYPSAYGPRPPSFARATVVPGGNHATVFISGTAAIRGHATIAPHDLRQQLVCTLENLREVSSSCGLGPDLGQRGRATRHFQVYLRHASDQSVISDFLAGKLLLPSDHVTYVPADICRATLRVEIEASLFHVATAPA